MFARIGVGSALVLFFLVACTGIEFGAKDQPKEKDKDSGVKNNCEEIRAPCNKNEQC